MALSFSKQSLFLVALLSLLPIDSVHASDLPMLQEAGWLDGLPSLFRAGAGFACSTGAAAALAASAYILARNYTVSTVTTSDTRKKSYLPPREFFWSMTTAAACIAALYALTATTWSYQT